MSKRKIGAARHQLAIVLTVLSSVGCGLLNESMSPAVHASPRPVAAGQNSRSATSPSAVSTSPSRPLGGNATVVAAANPSTSAGDLPAWFVKLLDAQTPEGRELRYKFFNSSNRAFEESWKAYQARLRQVESVLAQAKGKKPAEAVTLLAANLTTMNKIYADYVMRQLIEVEDAEMGIIKAIAALLKTTRRYDLYGRLVREFNLRRTVGTDKERERKLWFGYRNRLRIASFGVGQTKETEKLVEEMLKQAEAGTQEGRQLSVGFMTSNEALGFAPEAAKAKKGEWVIATTWALGIDGRQAHYEFINDMPTPYNCRSDGKLKGINPVTGEFIYGEICDYRKSHYRETLKATLVHDGPDWVKNHREKFYLAGKVVVPGRNIVLTNAYVLDLRFWREAPSKWAPDVCEDSHPETGELQMAQKCFGGH